MSKASEWAARDFAVTTEIIKAMGHHPTPTFILDSGLEVAYVWRREDADVPRLFIQAQQYTSRDALALARWILDTFGESE